MLLRLVVAALAHRFVSTDIDWVRYPGFHPNKTDGSLDSRQQNSVTACAERCSIGPSCDCSSFNPAVCEKAKTCRNHVTNTRVVPHSSLGSTAHTTTKDLQHKITQITGPVAGTLQSAEWKLTVDDSSSGERQTIDGFGAAWTDATVTVFDDLSKDSQEQLLEDLFGDTGIRLGFMRHTIGQSDLTPSWIGRWSYDENEGMPDPNMSRFNLTENGRKMVAWLSRMYGKNPEILLLGSLWSPASWMKSKNNQLKDEYVDAWVNYIVKYLQSLDAAGVKVDAMTIQNEPLHSGDPAWTMYADKMQAVKYTNRLSPAIIAAGLQTKIWAYDHNTDRPDYPAHVVQNSPSVKAVAWHCYGGGWTPLTDFQKAHPDVRQYMTECWNHLGTGENFFDLPRFIGGPIQNYASGSLAWVLAGSSSYDVGYPGGCKQCSGIIQVDRKAKTYDKTQDYYNLGQFSKFVKKGSTYLAGAGDYTYLDGTGVSSTHYRNPDGDLVVVIVNNIKHGMHIQVDFKIAGPFWGFVPTRSVTTWVFSSKSAPAKPIADPTCKDYCASTGCAWTANYSCPWQPLGSRRAARNDGSIGYDCCCGYQACGSKPKDITAFIV